MNGEHLYWRYVQLQSRLNNCGCEAWGDLERDEQQIWEALAEPLTDSSEK